jgi:ribonuclease HI
MIKAYTDGSASPTNPGIATWAVVLIRNAEIIAEYSGIYSKHGTNNQAEMYAAIQAIEITKEYGEEITIITDSEYVKNGVNMWLSKWIANNWQSTRGPVKNRDLWEQLIVAMEGHEIIWNWVKGHSGDKYNERCDQLCREAINAR